MAQKCGGTAFQELILTLQPAFVAKLKDSAGRSMPTHRMTFSHPKVSVATSIEWKMRIFNIFRTCFTGDIETNVHSFAMKWQTKDSCDYLTDKIVAHPCQVNVEKRAGAEAICSKLKDKLFAECHLFVEPEEFYEDCIYDVCACKGDMSNCFCPIMASYAAECARRGVIVSDWRYRVPECGELSNLGGQM